MPYCSSVKDDLYIEHSLYKIIFINCILDAVKWRQMDDVKCRHKDDQSVANVDKVDIKRTTKSPCLIVYSLIQKREVAHCYSVFYIEIFDFDNFDMILINWPCKKYS